MAALSAWPAMPALAAVTGGGYRALVNLFMFGGNDGNNLLVPLDGTELSERAMTESIGLARQLGASIVGFIAEPEMPLPDISTNLRNYQRRSVRHEVVTDTHAHDLLATFGERAQNAGVTFSWRADLGSVQGLRIASASEQTARLNAEKARLAAADQLHSDWQRVRAAITKVRASRAQVESARRAQGLAKERNAAGVATQLDVIQADRDLFSAEMNDISARLDLATARASLRLSAGLPLEVTP